MKIIKSEGPKFALLPHCDGCNHFDPQRICKILNKDLMFYTNYHLVEPHKNCPFKELNIRIYHRNELNKLCNEIDETINIE